MSDWIDELAEALGVEALTAARDGAHPAGRARRRAPGGAQGYAARGVPPGDARGAQDGRAVPLGTSPSTRRSRSPTSLLPPATRTAVAPKRAARVGWLDDRLAAAPHPASGRGSTRRHVRQDRRRPSGLGDGSVQLPVHVLHAGRRARLAAEERDPHVRGVDEAARASSSAWAVRRSRSRAASPPCVRTCPRWCGCTGRSAPSSTSPSPRTACCWIGLPVRWPRRAWIARRSRATR